MHQVKHKKGSALLTALFIMTLVAIVATAMSTKVQLDIYRTKLIIDHDKLYLASQAVTFWAIEELSDKQNTFRKANAQGIVLKYPDKLAHIDNTVILSGALYDLQARFNLNNLTNKKLVMNFISLTGATYSHKGESDQMNLTLALADWLSTYDLERGRDKYLSYYLSLKPPYYPGHQPMASASEFRLVKDVDSRMYLALEPFITALPETTPININTAPLHVLKSLGNTKNDSLFHELIIARKENGIKDLGTIAELLKKLDIPSDQITLDSTYFLNVAYASSDHLNLTLYSLLKRTRDKKTGAVSATVLRESINVF